MLGISLRLPQSPSDSLHVSLSSFISSNYSPEEFQSVQQGLSQVAAIRSKAYSSLLSPSPDSSCQSSIDHLTSYYVLLSRLASRFPFGAQAALSLLGITMGKIPSVRVQFQWSDALSPTHRVLDYDVNFERSSVLFNLGCLYSRQAAFVKGAASEDADENLKESIRLFSLASGVFDYLERTASFGLTSQSFDFHPVALAFLHQFMKAQSAACFFEKATKSASPKLVAKLALGVSDLFSACAVECAKPHFKQFAAARDVYKWADHCNYQKLCYGAAASYWLAKSAIADEEYGLEIALLTKARDQLSGAAKAEWGLLRALGDNRRALEQAINNRLASAQKDNDTCYYAVVPAVSSLVMPEPIVSVKATPFDPAALAAPGPADASDPFGRLVPPAVRSLAAEFRVRCNEYLSGQQRAAQEASDYARMHLASLNMPQAVEAQGHADGLPAAVWETVAAIQEQNKRDPLGERIDLLKAQASEAATRLSRVEAALAQEREGDEQLRGQFQASWTRQPSGPLTAPLIKELQTIADFLNQAASSNSKLLSDYQATAPGLALLAMSRQQIEEKIPMMGAEMKINTNNADQGKLQEAIKAALEELAGVLDQRAASINALTDTVKGLDSLQIALSGQGQPVDELFTQQAAKAPIEPIASRLRSLADRESALLGQIASQAEQFEALAGPQRSAKELVRQGLLQEINVAASKYRQIDGNVKEGRKFYQDLNEQRIDPLASRVDEFVKARTGEAKYHMEHLVGRLAAVSMQPSAPSESSGLAPAASPSHASAYSSSSSSSPINPALRCPVDPACSVLYAHFHCRYCTMINGESLPTCSACGNKK